MRRKSGNFIFQDFSPQKIKRRILIILLVLFIVLILFALLTGDRNIQQYFQLKMQVKELEEEIERLEKENSHLEEMINLIDKDPFFIEKLAREELKKAKRDEIIIEFQNERELEDEVEKEENSDN